MGIFPDESWLDEATQRHIRRDPEGLGFMNEFARYDAATTALLGRIQSNLLFIRGNHEAHEWLDRRERQASGPLFPVDIYQRVYCLKSGVPHTFSCQGEQITILGIGRIAGHNGQVGWKPSHLQDYEFARLLQVKDQQIDLLLTHDVPHGLLYPESGLYAISDALEHHRPLYHFFGHYFGHHCLELCYLNGVTFACKLAEPHFTKHGPGQALQAGIMGILRWSDRQQHHFEIVDAPWLKEYRAETWRGLP